MQQSTLVFYGQKINSKPNIRKLNDNIFTTYLTKQSIFRDKTVLTSQFIPNEILHRDNEILQLSSMLAPTLRKYSASNVFIYGGVGTGKTICVKMVLKQLNETAIKNKINIKTIYINCKMKKVADTEYRLFAQLLNEMNEIVPDTGLPTDVLYRRFFNVIDQDNQTIIIILDEIDALVRKIGDDFLYNLTRVNSELKQARLSLIGITNNLSFSNDLDARVKSSLGEEEMIFHPYNAVQLKDILKQRAVKAFSQDAIQDSIINKCAALAAQEHGDARRALDLLRVAGEIAERCGSAKIFEEHVDIAEQKIDLDRATETIRNQPKQSQAVLYAILRMNNGVKIDKKNTQRKQELILTGDVFNEYKRICLRNNLRILTQRRVSDLINELDMLGIINAKVISKGRYGRTREISLGITDDILDHVKKILVPIFE